MNTSITKYVFVDALDNLLVDCQSGDPARAINCRINTALGAITGIILPVFIVTGMFFNSLVAYIYLFKQSEWTRQNVYIGMMAVVDNCNIFMNGFMWMFLAKGLPWLSNGTAGYFHVNSSSLGCTIVRYFEQLCHMTSAALFLLMVADRTLSLYFPFKLRSVSGKSALTAGAAVILACIVIAIPKGYAYRWIYGDGTIVCYMDHAATMGWLKTAMLYYTLLLFFPPLLFLALILVGNILLIVKVKTIIDDRKKLTGGGSAEQQASIRNTVICVSLSVLLITSYIPVICGVILQYVVSELNPDVATEMGGLALAWGLYDMAVAIVNINQSINWMVLVWKSEKFRKDLLRILRCRRD